MTRKDYRQIAQVIRDYNFKVADPILGAVVADVLQKAFDNFNRDKFEKALEVQHAR